MHRHARARPGHPRPISVPVKTWMAGTGPGHDSVLAFAAAGGSSRQLSPLAKFAFGLQPEFQVAARGPAVLFPDFTRAPAKAFFARPRKHVGPPHQFCGEADDVVRGFTVADPARVAPVLVGLGEDAADELLAIHP